MKILAILFLASLSLCIRKNEDYATGLIVPDETVEVDYSLSCTVLCSSMKIDPLYISLKAEYKVIYEMLISAGWEPIQTRKDLKSIVVVGYSLSKYYEVLSQILSTYESNQKSLSASAIAGMKKKYESLRVVVSHLLNLEQAYEQEALSRLSGDLLKGFKAHLKTKTKYIAAIVNILVKLDTIFSVTVTGETEETTDDVESKDFETSWINKFVKDGMDKDKAKKYVKKIVKYLKKLHKYEKKFAKIVKKGIKALSESDTAKMEKYRAKYLKFSIKVSKLITKLWTLNEKIVKLLKGKKLLNQWNARVAYEKERAEKLLSSMAELEAKWGITKEEKQEFINAQEKLENEVAATYEGWVEKLVKGGMKKDKAEKYVKKAIKIEIKMKKIYKKLYELYTLAQNYLKTKEADTEGKAMKKIEKKFKKIVKEVKKVVKKMLKLEKKMLKYITKTSILKEYDAFRAAKATEVQMLLDLIEKFSKAFNIKVTTEEEKKEEKKETSVTIISAIDKFKKESEKTMTEAKHQAEESAKKAKEMEENAIQQAKDKAEQAAKEAQEKLDQAKKELEEKAAKLAKEIKEAAEKAAKEAAEKAAAEKEAAEKAAKEAAEKAAKAAKKSEEKKKNSSTSTSTSTTSSSSSSISSSSSSSGSIASNILSSLSSFQATGSLTAVANAESNQKKTSTTS